MLALVLGADTTVKSSLKNEATNLTTTATLLYSVSIGISVGLNQYGPGIGLTRQILIINYFAHWPEKKFSNKR